MTNSLEDMGIPVLAILRGIDTCDALTIAETLIAHDIKRLEVPLNSPNAFDSISELKRVFGGVAQIGAGTVLKPEEVQRLADIGCDLVVSPNFKNDVVTETRKFGMVSCPGVFTPSEAFGALDAGADILKYFPAELSGPAAIRAWRAVLPHGTRFVATGGTNAQNFGNWLAAGVDMIGVGSWLYRPGDTPANVKAKSQRLAQAFETYEAENG